MTAGGLRNLPHGRLARHGARYRPAASGDRWRPHLAERRRKERLRSNLLIVYRTFERAGEVVHLIAGRLRDQSALLGKPTTRSRDFH